MTTTDSKTFAEDSAHLDALAAEFLHWHLIACNSDSNRTWNRAVARQERIEVRITSALGTSEWQFDTDTGRIRLITV